MMAARIKRLSINLAVMAVSLLVVAIACEFYLRLFGSPIFIRPHQQLFVQHDPLLGWSKIPGKHARHITSEYNIDESLNSRGIRGPEYDYEKSPGEYRVMMLGDSFVEGYSVEFEETSSQVLQRLLTERGYPDCTVINGGTGGWSTDQEYLYFKNEAYKYHPDLTILMFHPNDIVGNCRSGQFRGFKPRFLLENGELILTNVPVPEPAEMVDENANADESLLLKAKHWLFANSRLYLLFQGAVTNNYKLHLLAIKLGLAESPGKNGELLPVPAEVKMYEKSYDAETRQAWDLTEALIVSLKQAIQSDSSRLIVFYVPPSAAVHDNEWQATKTKYGISDKDWSIHRAAAELKAVCEKNGIDFVDPTDRFLGEADRLRQGDSLLYFPHDAHWTAAGHRLSAEVLADFITQGAARSAFSSHDGI